MTAADTDRAALADIEVKLDLVLEILAGVQAKIDQLEQEFAPLARRAAKLTGAAAALPGARWRANGRPQV